MRLLSGMLSGLAAGRDIPHINCLYPARIPPGNLKGAMSADADMALFRPKRMKRMIILATSGKICYIRLEKFPFPAGYAAAGALTVRILC